MKLLLGNCLEQMKNLADNSVDAVVTDPPYGLAFMNKKWDYDVPSVEIWREVYRVLKPGGHVLSFGGTRTYHRMVVNIEDAGFEIRDQVMWIYGSGFPKSHNVSKAINKTLGVEREKTKTPMPPTGNKYCKGLGDDRPWMQKAAEQGFHEHDSNNPATPEAKQWDGWGSALKPANEPIALCRKPLEKGLTLAENVLKWGCGAINVDECRIGQQEKQQFTGRKRVSANGGYNQDYVNPNFYEGGKVPLPDGRWPANILFDEESAALLDAQSGDRKGFSGGGGGKTGIFKTGKVLDNYQTYNDCGGASRFFYVAKASKRERGDGNVHPTVKPIKLMGYLCKLITPPNGTILDPFMGSGSTGVAARKLGFDFIGCEMNEEYMQIATKRIEFALGDEE